MPRVAASVQCERRKGPGAVVDGARSNSSVIPNRFSSTHCSSWSVPPGSARLIRAQGALVTDPEIQSLVEFIARQGKPSYELEIHQQLQKPARDLDDEDNEEDESLVEDCLEVIRSEGKASTSLLQRRLKIGYGRAARMMDVLEERGYIGPARGAEPREILIDLDGKGHDGGKQQLV